MVWRCQARCRAEEDVAERGAGHYWRERTHGVSHATYTGNERPRGPKMSREESIGRSRDSCLRGCQRLGSKDYAACERRCRLEAAVSDWDSHDHDHDGVVDHDSGDHHSDSLEENVGSRDSCLRGCQRLGSKDYAACEMRCRLKAETKVAKSRKDRCKDSCSTRYAAKGEQMVWRCQARCRAEEGVGFFGT